MSVAAWPDMSPLARSNIYDELLPALKAKYPTVQQFSEINFYSDIEPVFFVPNIGTVHLDGVKYGGLLVNITEGTLDYTNVIIMAIAVLGAGILILRS